MKRVFPIRAVEDDHVDRPGVEVQQCMKLTGTNSSIGLIVLIDHAHLKANTKVFVLTRTRQRLVPDDDAKTFCPHGRRDPTIAALRTARQTIGDAPCACGLGPMAQDEGSKTCSQRQARKKSFLGQLLKYMHKACSYVPVWPLWHPCERQASKTGLPKQQKEQMVMPPA